jgi:hypothetical protein
VQTAARFANSGARQLSDYAASTGFRPRRRLTGSWFARNIIRIRTIVRLALMPPENRLFHVD